MNVGDSASWEHDVLPAWRRAAGNRERPNSDVWGKLPEGVAWYRATIGRHDIQNLYVIGSGDWKAVYDSYKLTDIAADTSSEADKYNHRKKIHALQERLSAGEEFEPAILVSDSKQGPFVIIDGNHRAVASCRLGRLVNMRIFIGIHPHMRDCGWFSWALQDRR